MVDIEKQLNKLEKRGFDFNDMILQGSVVLALLDIIDPSEVGDIDAIVNGQGYDFLHEELRWKQTYIVETDSRKLQDRGRNFEVFDRWFDGQRTREFNEMKAHAHSFEGFALGCIRKDIRKYKTLRMDKLDPKHLDDIKLFTSENRGYYLECLFAPHSDNLERIGEVVAGVAHSAADGARALGRVATLPQRLIEREESA